MEATYNKETDSLYIKLKDGEISESDEASNGVVLDYDSDGNVVGIDIENASRKVKKPEKIEYSVS